MSEFVVESIFDTFRFRYNTSGFVVSMETAENVYEGLESEYIPMSLSLEEVEKLRVWLGEKIEEYKERRKPFKDFSKNIALP